jgi:hypothetical protein
MLITKTEVYLDEEQWLDIAGFEGSYQVSSWGRVRSLDRIVGRCRFRGRILRQTSTDGYTAVTLSLSGVCCTRRIHRLVPLSFVGPCPDGMEAAHEDGVRSNNNVDNLRWDTKKGNQADRERHGTMLRGASSPSSKLTEEQVIEIKCRHQRGETQTSLAEEFGVSQPAVHYILTHKTWGHVDS